MSLEFCVLTSASLHQTKTAALAVGVFSNGIMTAAAKHINHASQGVLDTIVQTEFRAARPGSTLVLHTLPHINAQRVVLVGLGKQEEYELHHYADAEQAFAAYCVGAQLTEVASTLIAQPIAGTTARSRARVGAISASRAAYYYERGVGESESDSRPKLKKITHHIEADDATAVNEGLREGRAMGDSISLAATLGNHPSNVCTPTYLGEAAKQLAQDYKTINVEVMEPKQIEKLGMHSFLSVARGSEEPARFIVLRYAGNASGKSAQPNAACSNPEHNNAEQNSADQNEGGPIVLVGKGVTFDSGGISLKPAGAMDEMKYDMCGAASVLGVLRAVAELALPLTVIGLIPTCENMPSGRATKPGDIVKSLSGKTIEILNTDAEGRLILCDALTYAERFNPSIVIDVATLTGSCAAALGHINSGLFTQDDALAKALRQAGRETDDRVWRLPLEDAYQETLKSNFADVANIGGPTGGAILAACFLARFTKAYRWAHLDIAGTAWRKGEKKGATGRPIALLTQYLINLSPR
jgi:leucyl aminopeptidase